MTVRDGTVLNRGTGECPDNVKHVVNLNGQTVLPGLGDAHIHISDVGWGMEVLDLHSSRSSSQFLTLLASYINSSGWKKISNSVNCLEALGWWEEHELPTREEIDKILPDKPALFHRRCLHIIYMNSAAIAALGLNDDNYETELNVDVVRDNNRQATGILREGFNLVRNSPLKHCTIETQKRYILNGLAACVNAGLTQVHACEGRGPP